MDFVQSLEIIVTAVEDVKAVRLIGDHVHAVHIVHRCGRNVDETRDMRLHIIQRVQFNRTRVTLVCGPPEHSQADIYHRRIEGVDIARNIHGKVPQSMALAGGVDQVQGKIFENATVAVAVRPRKCRQTHALAKAQDDRLSFGEP